VSISCTRPPPPVAIFFFFFFFFFWLRSRFLEIFFPALVPADVLSILPSFLVSEKEGSAVFGHLPSLFSALTCQSLPPWLVRGRRSIVSVAPPFRRTP